MIGYWCICNPLFTCAYICFIHWPLINFFMHSFNPLRRKRKIGSLTIFIYSFNFFSIIHWFIYRLIHPFLHSFIGTFIHTAICQFIQSVLFIHNHDELSELTWAAARVGFVSFAFFTVFHVDSFEFLLLLVLHSPAILYNTNEWMIVLSTNWPLQIFISTISNNWTLSIWRIKCCSSLADMHIAASRLFSSFLFCKFINCMV